MVNVPGPVNDSVVGLFEALAAAADYRPPAKGGAGQRDATSMGGALRGAAASAKSGGASIRTMGPDGVAGDEAQGGWFHYDFPAPAGRETARLADNILGGILSTDDWETCRPAFGFGRGHERNPIRTRPPLPKADEAGAGWADRGAARWETTKMSRGNVQFAVTDKLAGNLARRINEFTGALTASPTFRTAFAKTVQATERIGPLLHETVGKLEIAMQPFHDKPDFRLEIDIADLASTQELKRQLGDLTGGSAPSRHTVKHRVSNRALAPTSTMFQIALDDPKLDQVLSALDAFHKGIGRGRKPGE